MLDAETDRIAVRQRFERLRADDIERALPRALNVTGALVQMPNYQKETPREVRLRDPKAAVRLGLSRTGRVSQFITPLKPVPQDATNKVTDTIKNANTGRVANALRDLLRQMDFSLDDVYRRAKESQSLPDEMDFIAIWVARLQKRRAIDKYGVRGLPMLVHMPYGSLNRQVYLPDAGGFRAYSMREAMLQLARLTENDNYSNDARDCSRFFAQVLERLPIKRDALLLVSRDNMGEVWPEISDRALTQGDLHITGPIGEVLAAQPKIRVARLRTSFQWVPPVVPQPPTLENPVYEASFGHFLGLYGSPDPNITKVFYSIQSHPSTQHQLNGQRQVDSPTKASWNPRTVEITMANLHDEDVPFEWAWVAHRLREESPHFDDATSMPEPLHALSRITEYILRLEGADSQADQGDEAEEPLIRVMEISRPRSRLLGRMLSS